MFEVGSFVVTKKKHVCGSSEWKVVRTGADIKLECVGCKRIIMMPRFELEKKVKNNGSLPK